MQCADTAHTAKAVRVDIDSLNLLRAVRHFTPIECKARETERNHSGRKKAPGLDPVHRLKARESAQAEIGTPHV